MVTATYKFVIVYSLFKNLSHMCIITFKINKKQITNM